MPRAPSQPNSVPSSVMLTLFSFAKHARAADLQAKRFVSARRPAVRKLNRCVWRLVTRSDLDIPSAMSASACARTSGPTRRRLPDLPRRSATSFAASSYRDVAMLPSITQASIFSETQARTRRSQADELWQSCIFFSSASINDARCAASALLSALRGTPADCRRERLSVAALRHCAPSPQGLPAEAL